MSPPADGTGSWRLTGPESLHGEPRLGVYIRYNHPSGTGQCCIRVQSHPAHAERVGCLETRQEHARPWEGANQQAGSRASEARRDAVVSEIQATRLVLGNARPNSLCLPSLTRSLILSTAAAAARHQPVPCSCCSSRVRTCDYITDKLLGCTADPRRSKQLALTTIIIFHEPVRPSLRDAFFFFTASICALQSSCSVARAC
jgi:hypothetical protein